MQFAGPRTLLAVHAHPGDESTATGGLLALYARRGVRTVVVTCTNGEFDDALSGAVPGEVGHHPQAVAAHRKAELQAAADALGITDLELLGYHDSGHTGEVPGGGFCTIPVETAAGRLAALVEHYRPQVVVTHYSTHRDHIHVNRVAKLAVRRTGIPAKLYLTAADGSTTIDISEVADVKRKALQCHASQQVHGAFALREHYFRAADTTGAPLPETDVFAGVTHHGPDLPRW
ncbi:N-acetylglucosaminyl deacetylase, LmbE family [Lentzea xinjiangensis]|uniref:N-acetylglucosaminyl deacetylase, LmbE family n=1 Tax=Lentzea xinjiangensis TaxID=402600 RepID=A0A1H9SMA9_9PSEU|nr:PIG-L deacetylase family protein [Lentzea xinjiangensis]SER86160.1 N-acetylglucosaminyl deacetylase, LmbE family [Lentzea xinjiangensis]